MPSTLEEARTAVARFAGNVDSQRKAVRATQTLIASLETEVPVLREAIQLARKCLDQCVEMRTRIEDIEREGLRAVFQEELDFMFEPVPDEEGSSKGLRIRIKTALGEFADPKDDFSAGVLSVAGLLLHIAIAIISGKTARFLVIDEPLPTLNAALWHRLEGLLYEICAATGLQIVIVTHFEQAFGKVYRVVKRRVGKREVSFAECVRRKESPLPGEDPWEVVPESPGAHQA